MSDTHNTTIPVAEVLPDDMKLSLSLLERVRLILRGGSVVDWYKLGFKTKEEVTAFLRVNTFDIKVPEDEERIRSLFQISYDFLHNGLGFHIEDSIWNPSCVTEPFLIASGAECTRDSRWNLQYETPNHCVRSHTKWFGVSY